MGGEDGSSFLSSVELYGQATTLPALPHPRYGHVSFLSNTGDLVTCGGRYEDDSSCVTLRPSPEPQAWEVGVVGDLRSSARYLASVVTLAAIGTYVLGGDADAETTGDVLLTGSSTWTGLQLPMNHQYGCATAIGRHQFLVTGGRWTGTSVREFDARAGGPTSTKGWRSAATWPQLQQGRGYHACATIGSKVIVAGGEWSASPLSSMEILDLESKSIRYGGDLQAGRYYFHLATVGEGAAQRLLAFGGVGGGRSVEEWRPARGTWRTQELGLSSPRDSYGSVVLPPSLRCDEDLPTIPHGAVDCPDSRGVGTTCSVTCTTDLYVLETPSSTVVCGWGSAWVTRATCG